ncbi:hypothetical protein BS47DRAFT_321495 [Hydnum rufescens UP504]|uniref:Uncharacterized protein n=1 Tax=Hydnum rufescens UP504 TaxID=1448309 RepID=A0A9P6AK68_9AGAM|nr:hypothetical protein BS47DRAFT_321495 [Hydnum rufescens UP504]
MFPYHALSYRSTEQGNFYRIRALTCKIRYQMCRQGSKYYTISKDSMCSNNHRNGWCKTSLMVWVVKIPEIDDVIIDDPNVSIKADAIKRFRRTRGPKILSKRNGKHEGESRMFPKRPDCVPRHRKISYQDVNIKQATVNRLLKRH